MDIVVAGLICLDVIPVWGSGGISALRPGSVTEVDGVQFSTGGAVANTGIALHRLGIDTALMGKVGNDLFGSKILSLLRAEGEHLADYLITGDGESSSYTIVLSPPNEDRLFLHSPGANHTFCEADIAYQEFTNSKVFHFGYPPLMRQFFADEGKQLATLFARVKSHSIVTSLDMAMPDPSSPGGQVDWNAILTNTLPYVDLFLPSFEELVYMIDRQNYQRISSTNYSMDGEYLTFLADKLHQMGAKVVVIKLGSEGIYLSTADLTKDTNPSLSRVIDQEKWSHRQLLAPCFEVEVVGTTGAGDTSIAGFLAAITKGWDPKQAISLATAVGACCVQYLSSTAGIKSLEEVSSRIAAGWKRRASNLIDSNWHLNDEFQVWQGPRDREVNDD